MLNAAERAATVDSIASLQLSNGMIPWFDGGHADPWNHVEAAMALSIGGRRQEAEAAYAWLAATQHDDGSWCSYYLAGNVVEDPRRDTNVSLYIATGVWQHYLCSGDREFLASMFPFVERAVQFALRLQRRDGALLWSLELDGTPGGFALLTGSSSAAFSLRCAIAIVEELGQERPEWELAAGRLAHAVARQPESFEPKDRWAMDWYYPVLCGALAGDAGRARLAERWDAFVIDGRGVRCVSDRPWVTAAETAECALAHDVVGDTQRARELLSSTRSLRDTDGSYWTGVVLPQEVNYPGGERSSYTAAAVVLADAALSDSSPASALFRGTSLPTYVTADIGVDTARATRGL
ncbi:MAG TPA: hypothetical protein VNB24_04320 [Acidimicrobiales bacterium]|nr:hypothetical protein [Acidimicrobiales bacterium]